MHRDFWSTCNAGQGFKPKSFGTVSIVSLPATMAASMKHWIAVFTLVKRSRWIQIFEVAYKNTYK